MNCISNFRSTARLTRELRTQQGRPRGQPQASAAADAGDGDRGAGSAPLGTSKAAPGHNIYPRRPRGLKIVEPNHVWAADVTYIPMACGFLYLVAIIDWASLGGSGMAAVEHQRCELLRGGAGDRYSLGSESRGIPRPDQGSTFTAEAFVGKLAAAGVAISMDGRGRFMDNIFIERLWRSIKYGEVHPQSLRRRPRGAGRHRPPDDLLEFTAPCTRRCIVEMPMAVWRAGTDKIEAAARAVDMPLRFNAPGSLPAHIPTADAEGARKSLILEGQGQATLHRESDDPVVPPTGSSSPIPSGARAHLLRLFGWRRHHIARKRQPQRLACVLEHRASRQICFPLAGATPEPVWRDMVIGSPAAPHSAHTNPFGHRKRRT